MKPIIRPMTLADAPAVASLHIRSWQVAYRGILPDSVLQELNYNEQLARRQAQMSDPNNPAQNWVCEHEQRVRAWVAVGPARGTDLGPDAVELYALYAHPNDFGKGFGRALIQHSLAHARSVHATEIVLWVLTDNLRSRRFYTAAGFEVDERQKVQPFKETGTTMIRLVHPLSGSNRGDLRQESSHR